MQTDTNSAYIKVNLPEGTNLTHSVKSNSKWNIQTRSQLVEDLYYTCLQDGEVLGELLDELVFLVKDDEERLDTLKSYTDEVLGEEE